MYETIILHSYHSFSFSGYIMALKCYHILLTIVCCSVVWLARVQVISSHQAVILKDSDDFFNEVEVSNFEEITGLFPNENERIRERRSPSSSSSTPSSQLNVITFNIQNYAPLRSSQDRNAKIVNVRIINNLFVIKMYHSPDIIPS